jgi:maltooligosyltrehalose trehalohydrolase
MHTVAESKSAASKTQENLTHHMPFGAELAAPGAVRFRLWAPAAETIRVEIEGEPEPLALSKLEDGSHELVTPRAGAGSRYGFVLPDGQRVPDPASRFQPEDVHGPSEVIDGASYEWHDGDWRGRTWTQAVIYELHIGTFTQDGTFLAAIDRLQHLVQLGVTAIQLMPVGDFAGRRNWGYDFNSCWHLHAARLWWNTKHSQS